MRATCTAGTRVALMALMVLGLLVPAPVVAAGGGCDSRTTIRPRYDADRFGGILTIEICRDLDHIAFDTHTTREDRDGGVVGAATGFAGCRDRVCRTRAVSIEHPAPEVATYLVEVWWGGGVYDSLGPITCRTHGGTASCERPSG